MQRERFVRKGPAGAAARGWGQLVIRTRPAPACCAFNLHRRQSLQPIHVPCGGSTGSSRGRLEDTIFRVRVTQIDMGCLFNFAHF